jgi:hypothetical protein
MGSTHTVTISAASVVDLPSEKKIRKLFNKHTDNSFEEFDSWDDDDLTVKLGSVDDGPRPHEIYFRWISKWETGGLPSFAKALSEKAPGCMVEWLEEWDNRDADEPGQQGERWLNGVVMQQYVNVWQPTPFGIEHAELVAEIRECATAYDKAAEGDSGDAEIAAAINLRDAALALADALDPEGASS